MTTGATHTRTYEALIILRDKKPKTAEDFSRMFWPDSVMHQRHYSAGPHGTRRGCGSLTGGSFLSKLQKRGLIWKHFDWSDPSSLRQYGVASLTEAGREYIEANL